MLPSLALQPQRAKTHMPRKTISPVTLAEKHEPSVQIRLDRSRPVLLASIRAGSARAATIGATPVRGNDKTRFDLPDGLPRHARMRPAHEV
jgi:hypothetical protein